MPTHSMKRLLTAALATLLLSPTLALTACGDDSTAGSNNNVNNDNGNENANANDNQGNSNNNNTPSNICLLNNCESDEHCVACSEGRTTCLVDENRCVACDPNGPNTCPTGQECSSYGICVDIGLTCPTDSEGVPNFNCVVNADCFACSPMNQVCNTTTHRCVACTETNTSHCLPSDICLDDACSHPCPSSCDEDSDCLHCEGNTACFQHQCAQCSATWPCAATEQCQNGVCVPQCGLPGPTPGTCEVDGDCEFCGEASAQDTWVCDLPVNSTHGVCVPPATGCTDLGGLTLPAPWNQYTELCTVDANCVQDNAGIQYDVGQLLRDQLGSSTIDVFGLATITIGDSLVHYPMPKCATIEINSVECGICVPCEVDSDCAPIDIEPLLDDLFVGGTFSEFIIDLALGFIFGEEPPQLNFFCQQVISGYGVCIPCANPFQACGTTTGGGGSGTCDHDVCTEGTPLDPSCGDCASTICNVDSFCCNDTWDSLCVDMVDTECVVPCGGSAGGCSPDICTDTTLEAQSELCNACTAAICADDPFCCNTTSGAWDSYCVASTADAAYATECNPICAGGCMHSECDLGAPLDPTCSACAGTICAADSFCCDTDWDSLCVDAAIADTTDCGHCN
ncbi:MAG: hypothetical protein ABI333_06155 [bacterium]